jgi:hypothetical protein
VLGLLSRNLSTRLIAHTAGPSLAKCAVSSSGAVGVEDKRANAAAGYWGMRPAVAKRGETWLKPLLNPVEPRHRGYLGWACVLCCFA